VFLDKDSVGSRQPVFSNSSEPLRKKLETSMTTENKKFVRLILSVALTFGFVFLLNSRICFVLFCRPPSA